MGSIASFVDLPAIFWSVHRCVLATGWRSMSLRCAPGGGFRLRRHSTWSEQLVGRRRCPGPWIWGRLLRLGVRSRWGCSVRNLWIMIEWPGADPASLNPNRSFMIWGIRAHTASRMAPSNLIRWERIGRLRIFDTRSVWDNCKRAPRFSHNKPAVLCGCILSLRNLRVSPWTFW